MFTKKQMIENAINGLKQKAGEVQNATGYKVDIDTLTGIKKKVTSQKFYEVKPSEFMPVIVGDQPFADQILTYKDYSTGNDFESGLIEPGSNSSRTESADTEIEGVLVPVKYWRQKLEYTILDLAQASKSGNWSLIESKERSRVKRYQLGIQRIAFLGLQSVSGVKGLLTQSDVTTNTTVINKNISAMTAAELTTMLESLLSVYFSNSNSTVMPDTFIIPTDDYLGLGTPFSSTYPNITKIDYLEKTFKQLTANQSAAILPLAYAQMERNSDFLGAGSGLNRYVMYRRSDEESLRMDIPVDYTGTIRDTFDNFTYGSVAYAGFTGCKAYRPKEMIYFDHSS